MSEMPKSNIKTKMEKKMLKKTGYLVVWTSFTCDKTLSFLVSEYEVLALCWQGSKVLVFLLIWMDPSNITNLKRKWNGNPHKHHLSWIDIFKKYFSLTKGKGIHEES